MFEPNPWGAGLPVPLARYYSAQLVGALRYLHTRLHVVHRGEKGRRGAPCRDMRASFYQ